MPMLESLWWDAASTPASYTKARIVAYLKRHSPKIDTDMLYRIGTSDHSNNVSDSDDDRW
ncbi:hypothetical protein M407DRAFT_241116 [Tulasnella calospora MUT 4182]|uniref:Uncharacterized protein n=1 Tax=Tulasnella calospora MUT 4182 TaxID=1051891 RepID=A0A0C3LH71_9AGAM|nr:hypothetical protein M407DRAFT_241116 [Tulasnella calospora MUT 4182]